MAEASLICHFELHRAWLPRQVDNLIIQDTPRLLQQPPSIETLRTTLRSDLPAYFQSLLHIPPSSQSPPCQKARSSSLTRTSPRRLTNSFPKLRRWHRYIKTMRQHAKIRTKLTLSQKNVQAAIEKLMALEKQTRQVSPASTIDVRSC